ncbi:hypothetical protein AYL99_05568 [Fonsecaea erecta]|uniref:Uncharacterized protein n=1 Tax=Fonsecaea erecta TaxID=1367422 RepID=A0A178ZMG9_9EURO|nr:hypothetical protein AYL99_05568 [Fonsecaea erecta]OAP60566.1 hypothetical protein AYL99_05568 [Fonsecaea erecta]
MAQIQLQLLLDDTSHAPWTAGSARATRPPTFYLLALLAQFRSIKEQLDPGLENTGYTNKGHESTTGVILAQHYYTDLITHETMRQLTNNLSTNSKLDYHRHQAFADRLACIRGFFGVMLPIPSTCSIRMSFPF